MHGGSDLNVLDSARKSTTAAHVDTTLYKKSQITEIGGGPPNQLSSWTQPAGAEAQNYAATAIPSQQPQTSREVATNQLEGELIHMHNEITSQLPQNGIVSEQDFNIAD